MVAFTAGSVLTAANLNSAFNALTIRTVTGTSDTLVLADAGGCVTYSNASATTSTIPPFSSIAYATGTKIVLVNLGAGVVTVTAGVGVTVNGATLTLAQNAGGTCIKTATNTWSFLPFSSGVGAANFSDTATGSYTGYKYKTFSASGTITVTTAGFADIVVCSGGGGGGTPLGGGGAGGVLIVTNAYLPVGTLTVTVGAGGSAVAGGWGQPSRLGSYYSVGGAAAIDRNTPAVSYGGSGAGGAYGGYAGTSGTPGIGNNGGAGGASGGPTISSGGGGGAGAVGAAGSGTTGGNGGAGTTTTIAGTTPTGAYVAGSYALGGGGGGQGDSSGGTGGSGGGGNGAVRAGSGTAGAANTGGGGGSGGAAAGAGGSGIVIVRVAV